LQFTTSRTDSVYYIRADNGSHFVRPLGIPHTKPSTKFEVTSSRIFEDMFDRMPKIVGVTWPGHSFCTYRFSLYDFL